MEACSQSGASGRRATDHTQYAVQPEICSNISTAPVELYHRVLEAKQCLLHSLCVLPLWMPEISRTAPVAVLEILQPETQPNFESLHDLVRSLLALPSSPELTQRGPPLQYCRLVVLRTCTMGVLLRMKYLHQIWWACSSLDGRVLPTVMLQAHGCV